MIECTHNFVEFLSGSHRLICTICGEKRGYFVKKQEIHDDYHDLIKIMSNKYVIVRTYSAGVFAGYLESQKGQEVVLKNARRLWYWEGAASLSQLAMEGVSKPEYCKFPCEVRKVKLMEAIEILDVTEKAKESIANVKIWSE